MSLNGPRENQILQLGLVVQTIATVQGLEVPNESKKLTPMHDRQMRQQALARNQQNPAKQKPRHFAKSDTPIQRIKK